VQTFATTREAKEHLIGRIVAESEHDNIPLSEIERKMLYFSETAWSLPDIYEVNEAFEREYNSGEYEEKIATLITRFRKRASHNDPRALQLWKEAVKALRKEDHYLLVLIGIADGTLRPISSDEAEPSGQRMLKTLLIGFAIGCCLLGSAYVAILLYAHFGR
jgi:hypothetical protein